MLLGGCRKSGLEWAFRLMLEPRRLFSRYARNAWFILQRHHPRVRSGPQPTSDDRTERRQPTWLGAATSMIISQTPYRVSFAGGGTDLPAFYRQEYGAVLSTTIDQHMYVTIHRRFEPTIRVSYSRTEMASTLDEVQHELVREAMRQVEIDEPLEITTIGDVPAGTGMGSSSSLTVGLLNALYAHRHRVVGPDAPGRTGLPHRDRHPEASRSAARISTPRPSAASTTSASIADDTVDVEPVPCRAETLTELEQRTLAALHRPNPRRQQILERQSSGHGRPDGRAPADARPGRRDAAGADRRRRPRSVRVASCTRAGSSSGRSASGSATIRSTSGTRPPGRRAPREASSWEPAGAASSS